MGHAEGTYELALPILLHHKGIIVGWFLVNYFIRKCNLHDSCYTVLPYHVIFLTTMLSCVACYGSSHWVVVVTMDGNVAPSLIPDRDLISYTESIGQTKYVAVVVGNTIEDQWEKTVVLGNGNTSTWNGKTYYNAPLSKSVSYYMFIRAYVAGHVDLVS